MKTTLSLILILTVITSVFSGCNNGENLDNKMPVGENGETISGLLPEDGETMSNLLSEDEGIY